jgi:hypothetical protein
MIYKKICSVTVTILLLWFVIYDKRVQNFALSLSLHRGMSRRIRLIPIVYAPLLSGCVLRVIHVHLTENFVLTFRHWKSAFLHFWRCGQCNVIWQQTFPLQSRHGADISTTFALACTRHSCKELALPLLSVGFWIPSHCVKLTWRHLFRF